MLTLTDGEVTIIGKARGSRQGNNLLVQKIHESGGIDFSLPILLGYTGLSDACCRNMWRTARRSARSLRQSGADAAVQCDRHTYGAGCRSGRVLQERCLSAVNL